MNDQSPSLNGPPACQCGKRHRRWRALARCRWPRADLIAGEGRFASVSFCPPACTVLLSGTLTGAEAARAQIDATGCCGRCWGAGGHRVVDLAAA